MRPILTASLSILALAAVSACKARQADSGLASTYDQAGVPETEYQLSEWRGGRQGEIACACDGGTLVRYHVQDQGVARVVLSQHESLEACVVARLAAKDVGKEQKQCRYAF